MIYTYMQLLKTTEVYVKRHVLRDQHSLSGMGCQVSGNPWALEFEFDIRLLPQPFKISIRQYFLKTYVFVMALTFMPVAWDWLKLITKISERITGDLLFRRSVCGLCTALLALWCSHNSESRVSVLVRAALFCEALFNYSRPDFVDRLHLYLTFHSKRPYGLDSVPFCNLETIHRVLQF